MVLLESCGVVDGESGEVAQRGVIGREIGGHIIDL
jgi:hypothetical protein